MIPQKLKNLNLFVDNVGYAGKVTEVSLPKIEAKTEEWRGGGMDSPIEFDMGLNAMVASFTLAEYSPHVLKRFGLVSGNSVELSMRGYAEDERGNSMSIVAKMTGRLKGQDMGSWKPGEGSELKGEISCEFYSLHIDGSEIYHISAPLMIRRIGGVDQLKEQRKALGMDGLPLVEGEVRVNLP